MIRCKPEKMDTKEYGQMFKRILTLEEDGLKGQKKKDHQEGVQKDSGGVRGGMYKAQKGLWNIAKKRMLEDRGALPKEKKTRLAP